MSGFFFKVVLQAVLLFRLDNWVVTPYMGKALEGFQAQVERRFMGQLLQRKPDGKWIYTTEATARGDTGLLKMEEYIRRCQNMAA